MFLVLASVVCLVMKPRYKAEAQIQVLKHDFGTISLNDRGNLGAEDSGDALDFNLSLQTQVEVLKSETLALRVIRELDLAETPEYKYDPLLKNAEARRQMDLPFDQAPRKRAYILKRWFKNLSVDAIAGTRLIKISYMHPDASMAARIVNQLLSDFVDYNFQVRYTAISKASDWLSGQLGDLKAHVEETQQHAAELQKNTGIFGTDETHNVALTRLEQLNAQVAAAETNRFMKEAVYKLARDGDPEVVAGMLGSSAQGPGSLSGTTPALLISLRQQEAALNSQYAEAAAKYGSDHPRIVQIKEQLNAVRTDLKNELDKVAKRAGNEYSVAISSEAAAKNAYQQQTAVAVKMNSKAVDYMIAKHEADSNRELYERLLQRVKEAGVVAGLHSNDVNVVSPALTPDNPANPNIPLYLAFGGLSGLLLGIACACLSETMDCTLRNLEDIEAKTSVPLLGIIPRERLNSNDPTKGESRLASKGTGGMNRLKLLVSSEQSMIAESFRALRTSLLLSRPDLSSKVIMVTSGLPSEGKTFTSLNLAATLAQNGSKVLLVDADFRHGSLSKNLQKDGRVGLAEVLAQDFGDDPFHQVKEVPGLTFIGAGTCPSYTAELLGSKKMAAAIRRWREKFDFVVIDTPPVLALTDAIVLSPNVDTVVLVVRFAVSTRQSIERVIRTFRDVQVECRGVIVNGMDVNSTDYFQYSGAYGDKYAYGYATPKARQITGTLPDTKSKGDQL
jgi:capsular exopolysaccharide synthesis family protein